MQNVKYYYLNWMCTKSAGLFIYQIYGGEIAGKLLSIIARLFTAYLQYTGFTLGVQAILVADKAEKKRRDIMDEGRECGDSSAIEAMNLDPETDKYEI